MSSRVMPMPTSAVAIIGDGVRSVLDSDPLLNPRRNAIVLKT